MGKLYYCIACKTAPCHCGVEYVLKDDLRKLVERMREGRDYYEKDGSISKIPYMGKDCADMIEELLKGGE